MTRPLQFIPFRSHEDAGWTEIWNIYEQSFPECERWRAESYARAFEDPCFEADGIWVEGRPAGLLFHWRLDEGFRYIEHLAVDPALRGQRLGAQVLERFCNEPGRRVVLEIDPPEDEISCRRRGFYERSGFVLNPYDYIHPSFRRPFHPHRLMLMSRPGPLSPEEARRFADFVRGHVLRYSDHEAPALPRL